MRRSVATAAFAGIFTLTCNGCPSHQQQQPPAVDTQAAHTAQVEKENQQLRAEAEAAQQASAKLDETLRGVEQGLSALPGMDADIRDVQRNIETGIGDQTNERKATKLMHRLTDLLQDRRNLLVQVRTHLADANRQAATLAEQYRKRYADEIARLETTITAQETENSRLRDERDDLAKKLNVAIEDAKQAHEEVTKVSSERDQERQGREEAENVTHRVLVVVDKIAELRKKGIVVGRWYQRKTVHCTCSECFTTQDDRTLTMLEIPAPLGRVRIYSVHPSDSYRVIAHGPKAALIEILDPGRFWSTTKCAVAGF